MIHMIPYVAILSPLVALTALAVAWGSRRATVNILTMEMERVRAGLHELRNTLTVFRADITETKAELEKHEAICEERWRRVRGDPTPTSGMNSGGED